MVLVTGFIITPSALAALLCEESATKRLALASSPDSSNEQGNITTVYEKQVLIPDASGDRQHFGTGLSLDGDLLAVGQERHPESGAGRVELYQFNEGIWEVATTLVSPNSQNSETDVFGYAALDGDFLVIGAPWQCPEDNGCRHGAAYIYARDQGGNENWGLVTELDGPAVFDLWFGFEVAINETTVAIGAAYEGTGVVYLYEQDAKGEGQWGRVKRLTMPETSPQDSRFFGQQISLVGDSLILKAENPNQLFLYRRDEGGADNWGFVQEIDFPCQMIYFAFDGETLVLNVRDPDLPSSERTSALLFYENSSEGVWERVFDLEPSIYVWDLDLDGNQLLAGAVRSTEVAYTFVKDPVSGHWSLQYRLATNQSFQPLTYSLVALDNGHAVISYFLVDTPSNENRGIVFSYEISNWRINAGLNDAWYNPLTDGQGFFVTVFPDIGKVFLSWFTYDTEFPAMNATANLGDPGHRWLTAFGPYAGNQAVMNISITSGGLFDSDVEVQNVGDGTIILTFEDCNSGTVEYDIPSINRQGTVPIQRIANDNIALCDALKTD